MPKMVNFAMFLKTRKLKWDILDDFQTLWKLGQVTTYLSKSVVKSLCFVRRIRNDKLRVIWRIKCYNSIRFQNPFTFWEKWFEIKILNCSSGSDQGHRLVFKHWHFFSCRNPKRQIHESNAFLVSSFGIPTDTRHWEKNCFAWHCQPYFDCYQDR